MYFPILFHFLGVTRAVLSQVGYMFVVQDWGFIFDKELQGREFTDSAKLKIHELSLRTIIGANRSIFDQSDAVTGHTLLTYIISNLNIDQDEMIEICTFVLAHFASLDAKNHFGFTPLMAAAERRLSGIFYFWVLCGSDFSHLLKDNRFEIFDMFIKNVGFTPALWTDKLGNGLLHLAVDNKSSKVMIEYLLDKGCSPTRQNSMYWSPLFSATQADKFGLVELFLKYTVPEEVNSSDGDGFTALHIASEHCNFKMVKLLIKNGANVNSLTNDRWTALHFAIQYDCRKISRYLVLKNANLTVVTNDGYSIFDLLDAGDPGFSNLVHFMYEVSSVRNDSPAIAFLDAHVEKFVAETAEPGPNTTISEDVVLLANPQIYEP
jgi:ankyrin repeat protein